MNNKIRISLIRSTIGRPMKHKKVVAALGLKKMNRPIVKYNNKTIQGMINKVSHLLKVEEIE